MMISKDCLEASLCQADEYWKRQQLDCELDLDPLMSESAFSSGSGEEMARSESGHDLAAVLKDTSVSPTADSNQIWSRRLSAALDTKNSDAKNIEAKNSKTESCATQNVELENHMCSRPIEMLWAGCDLVTNTKNSEAKNSEHVENGGRCSDSVCSEAAGCSATDYMQCQHKATVTLSDSNSLNHSEVVNPSRTNCAQFDLENTARGRCTVLEATKGNAADYLTTQTDDRKSLPAAVNQSEVVMPLRTSVSASNDLENASRSSCEQPVAKAVSSDEWETVDANNINAAKNSEFIDHMTLSGSLSAHYDLENAESSEAKNSETTNVESDSHIRPGPNIGNLSELNGQAELNCSQRRDTGRGSSSDCDVMEGGSMTECECKDVDTEKSSIKQDTTNCFHETVRLSLEASLVSDNIDNDDNGVELQRPSNGHDPASSATRSLDQGRDQTGSCNNITTLSQLGSRSSDEVSRLQPGSQSTEESSRSHTGSGPLEQLEQGSKLLEQSRRHTDIDLKPKELQQNSTRKGFNLDKELQENLQTEDQSVDQHRRDEDCNHETGSGIVVEGIQVVDHKDIFSSWADLPCQTTTLTANGVWSPLDQTGAC